MELVGKKFKLNPELPEYIPEEDNIVFYIKESKEDGRYDISWIIQDGEEVDEQYTTYDIEEVEFMITESKWILENE